jgi:hypothetical protein
VSLRIGFDLDGVLADMESELVRQAEILFGEAMTRRLEERAADPERRPPPRASTEPSLPSSGPESLPSGAPPDNSIPPLLRLNMTSRQQRKLWRHVEGIENFWETLEELEPGVIRRLAEIARERRWEIIFLTKRPETAGSTAQLQTQRWLEARGFELPSVFVVQGSRGRIAAALDLQIVVDDRPENCLDVILDSKARAILVWRESQHNVPPATRRLGIGMVRTTAECLDILIKADVSSPDAPTVMNRIRKLLGLTATF